MKRTLYTYITTEQRGFFSRMFRVLLMPLYGLYRLIVFIRNYCYKVSVFKQQKLPCVVISIGNIVVGGTGKTPTVATIAKVLQNNETNVSILLRGYKRKRNNEITIVSDGKNLLCSREESGDEANMLAHQLSNIPIIVGKRRYLAGEAAISKFNSEILILDDGYQHRKLARDLDILTIDATQPYGTGSLLPIGTLREPKSSIKRADFILLTRTDAKDINIERLKTELNQLAPNTPILESIHKPTSLYQLNQANVNSTMPLNDLSGKRLLAVCAIGNPKAFVKTLEKHNPVKVELIAYPDHHVYSESDIQQIQHQMIQSEAEWIVTTQKDEQKLASLNTDLPILVLAIELVITECEKDLLDKLQICQKAKTISQ